MLQNLQRVTISHLVTEWNFQNAMVSIALRKRLITPLHLLHHEHDGKSLQGVDLESLMPSKALSDVIRMKTYVYIAFFRNGRHYPSLIIFNVARPSMAVRLSSVSLLTCSKNAILLYNLGTIHLTVTRHASYMNVKATRTDKY